MFIPTRKLRKKVAEFLFHLLATKLVVSVFQVVVRDEIGVSCQLILHWKYKGESFNFLFTTYIKINTVVHYVMY